MRRAGEGDASFASRVAVLADAEALLTCYGVGEESGAALTHTVVELCFTSSVRFLQPGLLLKARCCVYGPLSGDPLPTLPQRGPTSKSMLCWLRMWHEDMIMQFTDQCLVQGAFTSEEPGADVQGEPRKSWLMRRRQERAAIAEGLAEWQANPYYCAGRVTVPALMDTFACHCFLNGCGPCAELKIALWLTALPFSAICLS